MKRIVLSAVSSGLLMTLPPAGAQNSLDGEWEAAWATARASHIAEVVINGETGTWQTRGRNRFDPCVGRKHPLAIRQGTGEGELQLLADGAAALQGCPDFVVDLKRRDARTLEGTRGTSEIVLRRK